MRTKERKLQGVRMNFERQVEMQLAVVEMALSKVRP